MISVIPGDAAKDPQEGVIIHVCNNARAWGRGFTKSLDEYRPGARSSYRNGAMNLGDVYCSEYQGVTVANMIAQDGIGTDRRRLNYEALISCLTKLDARFEDDVPFHLPHGMGCGLAGGNWEVVKLLLEQYLPKKDLYVYKLNK